MQQDLGLVEALNAASKAPPSYEIPPSSLSLKFAAAPAKPAAKAAPRAAPKPAAKPAPRAAPKPAAKAAAKPASTRLGAVRK